MSKKKLQPNSRELANFVESVGGFERLVEALQAGGRRVDEAKEVRDLLDQTVSLAESLQNELNESRAEVDVLTEAAEKTKEQMTHLEEQLTEARKIAESTKTSLRSGHMFAASDAETISVDEAHFPTNLAARLIK